MNRKKLFSAVALITVIITAFCAFTSRPDTAADEIAKHSPGAQITNVLPVNESGDAVCLYSLSGGSVGVAYLDCKGIEKYKARIFADNLKEQVSYSFKAADSNLIIHFELYSNHTLVPQNAPVSTKVSVNGNENFFAVNRLEEAKVNSYGLSSFDRSYLHSMVDNIVTSMQSEASSKAEELASNISDILS